jgi:putative selenate reductase
VCPNDAFFSIESLDGMPDRQQYLVFAELCNECGNCLTFCPEEGDPAQVKPRLYTDPELFAARQDQGQGFLIDGTTVVASRTGDGPGSDTAAATVGALLASAAGNPLGSSSPPPSEAGVGEGSP